MDMSKAFDMVVWSSLFEILVIMGVDCIFLRLILYIYKNQLCNVKWCSEYSRNFSVSNEVRQGAVSSAILFAIYIDDLLNLLEKSKRIQYQVNRRQNALSFQVKLKIMWVLQISR